MGDDELSLESLNPHAVASSEIWGGMNGAKMVYFGTSDNDFWKSRPGIKENVYEVNFD